MPETFYTSSQYYNLFFQLYFNRGLSFPLKSLLRGPKGGGSGPPGPPPPPWIRHWVPTILDPPHINMVPGILLHIPATNFFRIKTLYFIFIASPILLQAYFSESLKYQISATTKFLLWYESEANITCTVFQDNIAWNVMHMEQPGMLYTLGCTNP